jgi:type II secretory pathway component GspD/PulD (secretin)
MRKALLWAFAVSFSFASSSVAIAQNDGQQPAAKQPAGNQSAIELHQSPAAEAAMRDSTCCSVLTRQNDLVHQVVKTYDLKNLSQPIEMQDVVNGLRTILEFQRVQPIPRLNAIVVRGTPEQIAAADKFVQEVDRPRTVAEAPASYRLQFVFSDVENGKKTGSHTYTVVVQRGSEKRNAETSKYRSGSRVPIMTGTSPGQWQYNDVGVSIDCRLYGPDDALTLESTVEVSSVANSQAVAAQPVVRQTKSDSTAVIPVGRPVMLASLDGADSPRQLEIEVTATRVK